MLVDTATKLIGNTPLLELKNIEKEYGLKAKIFAKLESFEPTGSVKDRIALSMILDAEEKGLLKEGATIIEPTSGNTGIGIASIGAMKQYKVIIVMPENMSKERQKLIKAYEAEIILTPKEEGMRGAVNKANALKEEIPGSLILGQFENPANPLAHYRLTGPEIYNALDGKVDIFVAGSGTGGTISGVGKYLKEKNKDIKVIGVEPSDSPLITKGKAGPHALQGLGPNFVPKTLDLSVVDEFMPITNTEAFVYARIFPKKEGLLIGISAGAALAAAIKLAKLEENSGKNIVTVLPDNGDRYLSTTLFEE